MDILKEVFYKIGIRCACLWVWLVCRYKLGIPKKGGKLIVYPEFRFTPLKNCLPWAINIESFGKGRLSLGTIIYWSPKLHGWCNCFNNEVVDSSLRLVACRICEEQIIPQTPPKRLSELSPEDLARAFASVNRVTERMAQDDE